MTNPPIDPATLDSSASAAPTEPVPAFHAGFAPVEPEPALGMTAGPAPAPLTGPAPAPLTGGASAKRGATGSSRILNIALGVALLVAAGGVAFAVGRVTAPASTATGGTAVVPGLIPGGNLPNGSFDPNGAGFPRASGDIVGGGRGNGGFGGFGGGVTITGTVDAVSATSITVKLESGQTVTVGLDGSTTYHQQADAAASDVTAGKTVQLQLTGGFRPGQGGNGTGTSTTLGTAGSVTIIP